MGKKLVSFIKMASKLNIRLTISFQKQRENMGMKLVSFIKMASKLNIRLPNSFQKQKENMGMNHASFIKMASKLNIHLLRFFFFVLLLTVHLSVFISVINQLDA